MTHLTVLKPPALVHRQPICWPQIQLKHQQQSMSGMAMSGAVLFIAGSF